MNDRLLVRVLHALADLDEQPQAFPNREFVLIAVLVLSLVVGLSVKFP